MSGRRRSTSRASASAACPDVGEVPLGADRARSRGSPSCRSSWGSPRGRAPRARPSRPSPPPGRARTAPPASGRDPIRSSSGWSTSPRSHGPGIDLEASERRRPCEVGGVRHHRHVRGPPAREGDQRGLDPGRRTFRQALLIEALPGRPVGEPVEGRRPVAAPDERGVRDLDPVAHEVELRDRTIGSVGEVQLVGVGHPDVPARYVEGLGLRRHPPTVPWSP